MQLRELSIINYFLFSNMSQDNFDLSLYLLLEKWNKEHEGNHTRIFMLNRSFSHVFNIILIIYNIYHA